MVQGVDYNLTSSALNVSMYRSDCHCLSSKYCTSYPLIIAAIVFQVYLVNTPFLQDIDFETSHCSESEVGFNDK